MVLHWRPVGPLPAATYWRRRLAALLLLAGLAAGLWWLPGRAGDDTLTAQAPPTAAPTGSPTGSARPGPTPTPAADVCANDDLEVQATTDAADLPVGARAPLTLTVRNTSTSPCRRAVGQGAVELVITSGEDRIWSSDDCAPGGGEGVVVLEPGGSHVARATWPGTRSAAGCPPDQPAARPGTYRVTARIGDLRVPGTVFRVTE